MPPAQLTPQESRALVAQLRRSDLYRDYEKAFREATGLPIALRPVEAFNLPHHGDPRENRFCLLMSASNHTCAACLQLQQQVEVAARFETTSLKCFAGLWDSAVPLRVGDKLVGFLQTGQVLLRAPCAEDFQRATRVVRKLGSELELARLEAAYFQSRVIMRKQYESILRLLTIFAQHLSSLSNQLMVQGGAAEAPFVARARAFIGEHFAERLSLADISRAVNMSTFYFCKAFRKATGMTFTDYLARVRVERVKAILLNPQVRVSEAAYAVGFQSLSQFNRAFRRIAGETPSAYRERLGRADPRAPPSSGTNALASA